MKTLRLKLAGLTLLMVGVISLGTGCETKGPAEQAGEKIDRGVKNAKDAVDPAGPVEKAGRGVDNALNK